MVHDGGYCPVELISTGGVCTLDPSNGMGVSQLGGLQN